MRKSDLLDLLVDSCVTMSPKVSVDSLELVKLSMNANPSYHDISSSSDTCDGVPISPNGYDLSNAYVESSVM